MKTRIIFLFLGTAAVFSINIIAALPGRNFLNPKILNSPLDLQSSFQLQSLLNIEDSFKVRGNVHEGEHQKREDDDYKNLLYNNGVKLETQHEKEGSNCDCGARQSAVTLTQEKIVGGIEADKNEFPWRCNLQAMNSADELSIFCGCSVLNSRFVLTAAHCTDEYEGKQIYVDAGDHDLTTNTESENTIIKVKKVNQHPDFDSPIEFNNDISVLELETPLEMNRFVSPVCFPNKFKHSEFSDITVTASGWGTLHEDDDDNSNKLQKVDLPVVTTNECKKYFDDEIVSDNMLCTYKEDKDTCQGDSGGSIDYKDPSTGRYYAIGIVSFGDGCGKKDKPGVYTKITHYLDYINQITGGGLCMN